MRYFFIKWSDGTYTEVIPRDNKKWDVIELIEVARGIGKAATELLVYTATTHQLKEMVSANDALLVVRDEFVPKESIRIFKGE